MQSTPVLPVHLYMFLLVVVSLSCGSLPPADVALGRAAAATVGMVLAWGILCHLGARLCAKQVVSNAMDPLVGARLLEKQLASFRWLGLAVAVLCLAGFGLAHGLDSVPVLADFKCLQALVLLTPGLAITALTWSAEHRYGVMLGYTQSGVGHLIRSVLNLLRSNVAWLVVPVVVLLGLSDLVGLLPIDPAVAGWITVAVVLVLVPLGLPWMVRRLFKTSALDASTEKWIERLMIQAGLRRTRLLQWDTGNTAYNAMVVGFVPPIRTLLVSDRLLCELPPSQIAMVMLHEAAHLRRRHVPLRMLSVLPAWAAAGGFSRVFASYDWAMLGGCVIGIVLTLWILRVVAYRTEYDADVQACWLAESMAGSVEHVPSSYEQACDELSKALMHVTRDHHESRRATWLHPGIVDRMDYMRRRRTLPISNTTSAAAATNPA